MSCTPGNPTFRLLNAYVGWDADDTDGTRNLIGLDDPEGLQLALKNPDEIDQADLLAYFPPPRLARGCGPCEWYLVTPPPSRLLRLDRCSGRWLPGWNDSCDLKFLREAIAVTTVGHRLAVADRAAGIVWIWAGEGERISASINVPQAGPIAFLPHGELLVTVEGSSSILRFGPTGDKHGELSVHLPAGIGSVDRLAVSADRTIWLVTRSPEGALHLWKAACADRQFQKARISELATAFQPTGITVAAEGQGFCLTQSGPGGIPVERCFSWYGRPAKSSDIPRPVTPKRQTQGQLLTQAIDSGILRCRWHRVSLTADVPPGSTLTVSVSTSETKNPPDQGVPDPEWTKFPVGKPHPIDWQTAPGGSMDFLVRQPPGRYLFLRMRLTGDGVVTPAVRCLRLDFPRSTSLELLPLVYRENPDAEDFTERFLSLFDATFADLDRSIERYPALLDPSGVPNEVLPWLGSFLDIAFDPLWEPERRRQILREIPQLYRQRGTIKGLVQAFRLVFDVEPAIQELAAERSWGILKHGARLRNIRLFGRTRTRFRLGSSQLSRATIKSYGNPDQDPLNAGAYQFRILVPPGPQQDVNVRLRMAQLVESQKPAHTIAQLRFGGMGFILGQWSAIGVDTVFGPPPQPILGKKGNVRLRSMSVLWHGKGGRKTGIIPGQNSWVGINTIVE